VKAMSALEGQQSLSLDPPLRVVCDLDVVTLPDNDHVG
jgi:hypothetical protein